MVVGDLGVVEDAFVGLDILPVKRDPGKTTEIPFGLGLQGIFYGINVIFRQMAAIRPRVGQDLVPFVQGLGQPQGVFCGKAETGIRLTLQGGQVEELRGALARFFIRVDNLGGFPCALVHDPVGLDGIPYTVFLAVGGVLVPDKGGIDPFPGVGPPHVREGCLEGGIRTGSKTQADPFPLDQQGQGRGLDPSAGGQEEPAPP